jgi:hypothetical protein
MTERICEHCGKEFLAETFRDKLEEAGLYLVSLLLPLHALDCFREGGHGWLHGLFWLALAGSATYQIYRRQQARKGKSVKLGWKCPGCGDWSAHVDSPLGEQLIAYWSSPQTVDEQEAPEQPSTISGASEEDDSVVAKS